ncbi:AtpZ/AtpI family protein [Daejeonella sp.]|uniref:AtpZ/AtpI family protein n=1 Tax=Daejeonella sp. TaxID=2805397 RepID=UPI003983908A
MENQPHKPEINPPEDLDSQKRALGSYAKYTGVAFQMMAIIGASAFIGYKIDQYYDHKTQWVTALACVLGVCLSIYQTIRQLKS